jgi:hypothetical protein
MNCAAHASTRLTSRGQAIASVGRRSLAAVSHDDNSDVTILFPAVVSTSQGRTIPALAGRR